MRSLLGFVCCLAMISACAVGDVCPSERSTAEVSTEQSSEDPTNAEEWADCAELEKETVPIAAQTDPCTVSGSNVEFCHPGY